MKRIGVLGGSFDPPHLGHLLAAVYALKNFELDQVWFVVAYRHPFGKLMAPFRHRMNMCRILLEGMGTNIKLSAIERTLKSDGKTLKTLNALQRKYSRTKFSLIIGSDTLTSVRRWYRFPEIKRRYGVLVVPRSERKSQIAIPNISSTEIRRRIRDGQNVQGLLPPSIGRYIRQCKLYL